MHSYTAEHLCMQNALTPCSLAASVILSRNSSSTNGRTASWMMTTFGLGSTGSSELSLNAWRPLKIDLCLVVPPSTTLTFVWWNCWTMFSIGSLLSLATTTTMLLTHGILLAGKKKVRWFVLTVFWSLSQSPDSIWPRKKPAPALLLRCIILPTIGGAVVLTSNPEYFALKHLLTLNNLLWMPKIKPCPF